MSQVERDQGKENKERPSHKAWRELYEGITADANARDLPADRLRYRQEIEPLGPNETQSDYDIRIACYAKDELGRPRVVVADVYEDGTHIQQAFSTGAWREEGLQIGLVLSKVDRSYGRFTLTEIGRHATQIVQESVMEIATEPELTPDMEEIASGQTIFPVPTPKSGDAPN